MMKYFALVLASVTAAFAQEPSTNEATPAYEEPPVLNAAEILNPTYAAGAGFKVWDAVPTYAGRNSFTIHSDFGTFEAEGNAMLVRRVRELQAIARLKEVSRSDEFKEAFATAVKSPLLMTKGLIENPTSTISGLPKGMWKFMNRAGQGLKEIGKGRKKGDFEDSNLEQVVGFSKAKRDVALKLGVDPYSGNEVLQKELNSVAWASFAGKSTFTIATVPVTGGAGLALSISAVADTLEQSLRDLSPGDLRMGNLRRLQAMGIEKSLVEAFIQNSSFSPSLQTALVLNLELLVGVKNRSSFIVLATEGCSGESDATFFVETSRILAHLHTNGRTLARLDAVGPLPVAFDVGDNVIVALEWDYASWTKNAEAFLFSLNSAKFGGKTPKSWIIGLSGDASEMLQKKFKSAGMQVVTRLSPGPLKPQ